MSFCTAVNCLDGRVQEVVVSLLKAHFGVDYVDMITEAGPVRYLAGEVSGEIAESIMSRVELSVTAHDSVGIAVVAHYDCKGNPEPESVQKSQLAEAGSYLKGRYPSLPVVQVWVDSDWRGHCL